MKPKCCILGLTQTFAFLLPLVLAVQPARAGFQPLATGWEYQAPAGFTLNNVVDAPSIVFDVAGTFNNMSPVTITFRTTADKAQQFFWMGLAVVNGTGTDWTGFNLKLVDKYDPVDNSGDVHPVWAHFHPQASNGGNNTDYGPFNTLSATGFDPVANLTVSGGTVANGDAWFPTNIRLHDKATQYSAAGPMEFDLTLTPIPEPSTYLAGALLMLPVGLQGLRSLRNRKQTV